MPSFTYTSQLQVEAQLARRCVPFTTRSHRQRWGYTSSQLRYSFQNEESAPSAAAGGAGAQASRLSDRATTAVPAHCRKCGRERSTFIAVASALVRKLLPWWRGRPCLRGQAGTEACPHHGLVLEGWSIAPARLFAHNLSQEHAALGQVADFVIRHSQQLAIHVVVVFADAAVRPRAARRFGEEQRQPRRQHVRPALPFNAG